MLKHILKNAFLGTKQAIEEISQGKDDDQKGKASQTTAEFRRCVLDGSNSENRGRYENRHQDTQLSTQGFGRGLRPAEMRGGQATWQAHDIEGLQIEERRRSHHQSM